MKTAALCCTQTAGARSPSSLTTGRCTSWARTRAWSTCAPRSTPVRPLTPTRHLPNEGLVIICKILEFSSTWLDETFHSCRWLLIFYFACALEPGLLLFWWRQAHFTPVYNIEWNSFLPNIFISCAAEWSVKIWDMDYRRVNLHSKDKSNYLHIYSGHGQTFNLFCSKPLYTFDLNYPVGDVAWAPYSSTTFAAVTMDGKVNPMSAFFFYK